MTSFPERSLWTIEVFDGMQLVIAAREIAAVTDVRGGSTGGHARAKPARDAGAQGPGCGWAHDPDLDAIDIRRVGRMAEGRTAWLAAVFDVDAEDHIRLLLAGCQGHPAHAGDSNGIGVGSPGLRSAHSILGVADPAVGQRRQAVASQARATQAVEDPCGVETLQPAAVPVTNMLPLAANVRTAILHVDIRGGERNGLASSHLAAMGGELHAGVGDQSVARLDLQQSGGTWILAAAPGGSAEDLDAVYFDASATVHGAGTVGRARGSSHRNGHGAALHLNGAAQSHAFAGAQGTVERGAIRHGDAVRRILFQRRVPLVEGEVHRLQRHVTLVADRNFDLRGGHLTR